MPRSGPRKPPNAPVKWEEVWWWCEDIERRWGYAAQVSVFPPLPTKKRLRFSLLVELKRLKVDDGGKDSTMKKWRGVEDQSLTAEAVALTMVVELHRQLDNEELERERAAYTAGAMF
jgi:hypothetical protein